VTAKVNKGERGREIGGGEEGEWAGSDAIDEMVEAQRGKEEEE